MSDNRAQSIQSLHSIMETPTPDSTPSFDELQQRLDASNRNMQHLQDEQQKLLHIQNMAKSHLNEMEQLRHHAGRLPHVGNGDGPNYESVQQVQDDMASLVGRMKNLTEFIHNQNELSNILGDDGPDIMAEQQALQAKLESLRTQREDMRDLVDELNSINRTARETAQFVRQESAGKEATPPPPPPPPPKQVAAKPSNERVVPVEYQRNVPILRQEAASAAQRALHAQAMINQKTADIDALKAQMNRLKSMLNTVNQIDDSTPSAGEVLERRSEERNELPVEITQRVHALNDVTSELRAEAACLQKERDRILALKAEIERRKLQAAAAVQLGEEALQRNSLTPTPTPGRQRQVELEEEEEEKASQVQTPTRSELHAQCERLRHEYEQKQREYDLQFRNNNSSSNNNSNNNNTNTTSEADDEGNDTDSDRFFGHAHTESSATLQRAQSSSTVVEQQQYHQQQQQQQQQLQQQQLQQRRSQSKILQPPKQHPLPVAPQSLSNNEEDLNMTLDSMSLGNDSMKSSSTRSQYMPPPMPPVQGMWSGKIQCSALLS